MYWIGKTIFYKFNGFVFLLIYVPPKKNMHILRRHIIDSTCIVLVVFFAIKETYHRFYMYCSCCFFATQRIISTIFSHSQVQYNVHIWHALVLGMPSSINKYAMFCFVMLGESICKVCLSVLFRYLRTHEEFHLVFKHARVLSNSFLKTFVLIVCLAVNIVTFDCWVFSC